MAKGQERSGREQCKAAGLQKSNKNTSVFQPCCGSLLKLPVLYLLHGLVRSLQIPTQN